MKNLLFVLTVCLAITACSQSGQVPYTPHQPAGRTTATFVMHWPAKAAPNARHTEWISPSSRSVSISVNNGTATVVNAPTPGASPQTTNIPIDAPPGIDSIVIQLWDALDGNGNMLGQAKVSQQILTGKANTVNATVDGVCKQIAIGPASGQPYVETSSFAAGAGYTLVGPLPENFLVTPEDADGNAILERQDAPVISLTALAGIAVTQTAQYTFSLQPNSIQNHGLVAALQATSPTCSPGGATLISTSAAVFVLTAYPSVGVNVFDQIGNQISIPSGRFAGLLSPSGLAYAGYNGGTLYVTDVSYNTVTMYDMLGNTVSSYGGFPGLKGPDGIVSDTNNYALYVTNGNSSGSITSYDRIGDQLSVSGFTLNGPPIGIAYAPGLNTLYVLQNNSTF